MANHMEAAIAAASHWLFADDTPCEEGCACEMTRILEEDNLAGIITAALPHIRAMIAEEIRVVADQNGQPKDREQDRVHAAMYIAAQIAEGKQP